MLAPSLPETAPLSTSLISFATGQILCSLSGTDALKQKQRERQTNMDNSTNETGSDLSGLADDAQALMNATADVAGEKVGQARKRLSAALDRAKEMAGRVREKAVAGAKAADQAVHEHPYQAMAIAFGLGAIIGYLVARRNKD
jgi:ElaB/YqjD/DUF883 family membrane-anchored ribosome-binding protein